MDAGDHQEGPIGLGILNGDPVGHADVVVEQAGRASGAVGLLLFDTGLGGG